MDKILFLTRLLILACTATSVDFEPLKILQFLSDNPPFCWSVCLFSAFYVRETKGNYQEPRPTHVCEEAAQGVMFLMVKLSFCRFMPCICNIKLKKQLLFSCIYMYLLPCLCFAISQFFENCCGVVSVVSYCTCVCAS